MKKLTTFTVLVFVLGLLTLAGCAKKEAASSDATASPDKAASTVVGSKVSTSLETVEVAAGEPLVYLIATDAKASSFDETPDWAPEPNPMAPVDGDMSTRWSSSYAPGEQWIYFDLGQESVVSNVIVRWEKAHAADYKIMASNDANAWGELYHEKNGQSGAVEANFTPSKCRYVKILGLERANDDWGISMWEVEIYGPVGSNPHATVTKQAYLAKGVDETKEKEAEALISELAAPVVPIKEKEFQKGLVYTSWVAEEFTMPVSDFTLAYLKEIGFDTVSIMVPAYQEEIDSVIIFTNDKPDGDTPTMESLKHAVEVCHKLGMRVMIKPHVDPRTNEARVNIMPSEKWFDSYEEFILRYARFSQENGVELFSVGTELEATTFESWTHRWEQVIDKVRENYKGFLTYSANWTEYKEVPFWGKLDFIGIDAYFPLTGKDNPSLEELVVAWTRIADDMEKWLNEKNLTEKGVLLTEIGYPSADAANRQPWVAVSKIEDQQEQADCLEATLEVLTKRPWFKGYYIWQYFPQERWSPLGFTIKDKKAEEVVKEWLKDKEE
ncbi:MAG: discoidin domain-containing protein [Candidatus Omnitrophota bacterium]